MGQKIHPQGLRVGTTRKWNSSWFSSSVEWKQLFFYQREVENFFKVLFYFYSYTKISRRKKVLLFDLKLFKYNITKIFLFVFFYKLRTKRRKDVRPVLLTIKKKSKVLAGQRKFAYLKKQENKIKQVRARKFFFVGISSLNKKKFKGAFLQ